MAPSLSLPRLLNEDDALYPVIFVFSTAAVALTVVAVLHADPLIHLPPPSKFHYFDPRTLADSADVFYANRVHTRLFCFLLSMLCLAYIRTCTTHPGKSSDWTSERPDKLFPDAPPTDHRSPEELDIQTPLSCKPPGPNAGELASDQSDIYITSDRVPPALHTAHCFSNGHNSESLHPIVMDTIHIQVEDNSGLASGSARRPVVMYRSNDGIGEEEDLNSTAHARDIVENDYKSEAVGPACSAMTENDADPSNLGYCRLCAAPRPPRVTHCRSCRECILRYHHHCSVTACCIGLRNTKFFLLALFYGALVYVHATVVTFRFFMHCRQAAGSHTVLPPPVLPSLMVAALSFVTACCGGGFSGLFLMFHIRLALHNLTVPEAVSTSEVQKDLISLIFAVEEDAGLGLKFAAISYRTYSKQALVNLMHILGPSPWLWLIPVGENRRRGSNRLSSLVA